MNPYPLLIIVSTQLIVIGLIAWAGTVWTRKQKDRGHARLQLIRLLFWFIAAIAVFTSAVQVFLFATGRISSWFPNPSAFGSLVIVSIIYAQTSKSIRKRKQNGRTGSSS